MFGLFRLFLATNVVATHIAGVPHIGSLAVFSFFVLSGFLMTTIVQDVYGHSLDGFRRYALNRFLRIFPLYWVMLALTALTVTLVGPGFSGELNRAMFMPSNAGEWLANISLAYPEFQPTRYLPRLSPSTWALTIELSFYLLIGLGLSRNARITHAWFLTSLGYLLYMNFDRGYLWIRYDQILWSSLPFSTGALIYHHKEAIGRLLRRLPAYARPALYAMFLANLVIIAVTPKLSYSLSFYVVPLSAMLNIALSALVVATLFHFRPQSAFVQRVDKLGGDLSYPIYLFHWAGACLASWLLFGGPEKGLNAEGLQTFALALAITAGVSYFAHRAVNARIDAMRKRIRSNGGRMSETAQTAA